VGQTIGICSHQLSALHQLQDLCLEGSCQNQQTQLPPEEICIFVGSPQFCGVVDLPNSAVLNCGLSSVHLSNKKTNSFTANATSSTVNLEVPSRLGPMPASAAQKVHSSSARGMNTAKKGQAFVRPMGMTWPGAKNAVFSLLDSTRMTCQQPGVSNPW